jgi:hypothetical protein
MTHDSEEKEREAVGGFGKPVRHRQDPEDRERREPEERPPGPPGDINTGSQVVYEDDADAHYGDGTDGMPAAEVNEGGGASG